MKCLRSWRPSRITEKAAILRATPWALVLLFFIFMSILGAVLSCKWLLNLSCIVSILSFIGFLNRTLKSDQYYELKKFAQKGTVKLYIYKDNPFYKFYHLYVRTKDETCVYTIDKYEFFKIGKRRDWFIFAAKDDWYCQYFDTLIPLGKRLGQSVFIDKNKNDTRFRISALSLKNEIKIYMAERYFFGDNEIYIPELFDNKDHHTHYILIKENQSYKLISSSEICKKKRKMMLAGIEKYRSVIFKEDEETIILVWNENQKEYQEIYRGINDVPSLKCFLKLENSKFPSYGVVSKFDKRKKELTPIYEGEITFIDESQRIILGKEDDDLYPY